MKMFDPRIEWKNLALRNNHVNINVVVDVDACKYDQIILFQALELWQTYSKSCLDDWISTQPP